jgi:hypothetical protein
MDVIFPQANHAPAESCKQHRRPLVALSIRSNLLTPIIGIGPLPKLRRQPPPVAPVPEITIAEDHHSRRSKDDVRLAWEIDAVLPKAQAATPQLAA